MIEFDRIACQIDELTDPQGGAPVTRSEWKASNLPPGLKLSETGKLTGRPAAAGTSQKFKTINSRNKKIKEVTFYHAKNF